MGKRGGKKRTVVSAVSMLALGGARVWNMHKYWRDGGRKCFGYHGYMMESSIKLESSLYISFCYGGIVENVLNITFPPSSSLSECYGKASPGSYGRQEILLGYIYTVYVIVTFYHFLEYVFSGRTNDWLLYALIRTSRFILFTFVLREHR